MTREKKDTGGEKSTEKKSKKRKTADAAELAPPEAAGVTAQPVIANGTAVSKKLLLSPIATPLADDKLKKRALKLVKKAAKGKQLKRGVKEVVKALRKQTKG